MTRMLEGRGCGAWGERVAREEKCNSMENVRKALLYLGKRWEIGWFRLKRCERKVRGFPCFHLVK